MENRKLSPEELKEIAFILKQALELGTSGWSPELLKEVKKITASPLFAKENEKAIMDMLNFFSDRNNTEALIAWTEFYADGKGFGKVAKWVIGLLVASGVSLVALRDGGAIIKSIFK